MKMFDQIHSLLCYICIHSKVLAQVSTEQDQWGGESLAHGLCISKHGQQVCIMNTRSKHTLNMYPGAFALAWSDSPMSP